MKKHSKKNTWTFIRTVIRGDRFNSVTTNRIPFSASSTLYPALQQQGENETENKTRPSVEVY